MAISDIVERLRSTPETGADPDLIFEAADAIEQLGRHARRYTYLRERDLDAIIEGGVFAGKVPDNVVLNGDDLDAAIDAAIAKTHNDTGNGQRQAQLAEGPR